MTTIGPRHVVIAGAALCGVLLLATIVPARFKQETFSAAPSTRPVWTEIKWPFPLDQWGLGRAFICRAADCGSEVNLYLRAKLGFCNCSTGVSDDAELDRVGDIELLSPTFNGLSDGRSIAVGWMSGRSRPYHVAMQYGPPRSATAIAFNDKCDVVVATVVGERGFMPAAERASLEFLNGDLVLRWVEKELGL
jgi:hypothetical protein